VNGETALPDVLRTLTPAQEAQKLRYFYAYFEAITHALCVLRPMLNDAGEVLDYQILYVNPAAERQLGLALVEIVNKGLHDCLSEADAHYMHHLLKPAMKSGQVHEVDHQIQAGVSQLKPGWYRLQIVPCAGGLVVSQTDITEQKEAQRQLDTLQTQMRLLSDFATDSLTLTDSTGKCIYLNRAAQETFGYTVAELNNTPLTEQIHPDDFARVTADGPAQLNARGKSRLEFRARTKSGKYIWVEADSTLMPDINGEKTLLLSLSRNIDSRKSMEFLEERRREFIEKLRAVTQQLHSTLDVNTVLDIAFEWATVFSKCDAGNLTLLKDGKLTVVRQMGYPPGALDGWLSPNWVSFSNHRLLEKIAATTEPFVVADTADEPRWIHTPQTDFVRAHISLPVRAGNEVIGVFNLDSKTVGFFDSLTAQHLEAFASGPVALALQNAQIYQQAHEIASTRERQRIAHELHDSVMQTLFSASIVAQSLQGHDNLNKLRARETLNELTQLISGSLAEMRTLLVELRPAGLEDTNLSGLLQQLVEACATRTKANVEYSAQGEVPLPNLVQTAFYRIAQEAITNITRHAHPRHVRVMLVHDAERALLEIVDDGRGFDPKTVVGDHFGLQIMRERASGIGASLRVSSTPGNGTTVHLEWSKPPLNPLIR
jgi:PAS domain S-box-containing protein